jgi:hypothetical protein
MQDLYHVVNGTIQPALYTPTYGNFVCETHCFVFQMEVDTVHLNKRSDPYEFEDDVTAPAVSMEGFKRTNSVKVCIIHRAVYEVWL